MEATERRRSRKSQSFKRVAEDCQDENHSDSSGENVGKSQDSMFVTGNLCEGLQKQVSGMRRLLDNRVNSGRIHQPLMQSRGKVKREPEPRDLTWLQRNVSLPHARRDEPHSSHGIVWKDIQVQTHDTFVSGGYINEGSRSSKPIIDASSERIQGILESNGPQNTVHVASAHSNPFRSTLLRNKIIKKRLIHRLRPVPAQPNRKPHSQSSGVPQAEKDQGLPAERLTTEINPRQVPPSLVDSCIPELESIHNSDLLEPEVRLADGYDVLIPKSQLESILLNYSRTGSLLFRKLVSAFFDDRTLANSLPNGKRKRGANDNRKGLDQNIVGAIKVFTEKYCTLNQIDRVPGPKDWIQILQDQIKLARKRLKRGSVLESFESSGKMGTSFILSTGESSTAASTSDIWNTSEPVRTVQM
ncbi:BEN domain-containing protein 7 isoform X2 [Narcine bancroftii]|uniref:BEN domain-containing protein 7 isoform X2 n=1 Tax=Narcine bancroftii TaxID=1343680 RepID=UPI003831CF17